MNNDQRILEIDDIERALLGDDPTLPERMRADTLSHSVVRGVVHRRGRPGYVGARRPTAHTHASRGAPDVRRADVGPVRSRNALEQLK